MRAEERKRENENKEKKNKERKQREKAKRKKGNEEDEDGRTDGAYPYAGGSAGISVQKANQRG